LWFWEGGVGFALWGVWGFLRVGGELGGGFGLGGGGGMFGGYLLFVLGDFGFVFGGDCGGSVWVVGVYLGGVGGGFWTTGGVEGVGVFLGLFYQGTATKPLLTQTRPSPQEGKKGHKGKRRLSRGRGPVRGRRISRAGGIAQGITTWIVLNRGKRMKEGDMKKGKGTAKRGVKEFGFHEKAYDRRHEKSGEKRLSTGMSYKGGNRQLPFGSRLGLGALLLSKGGVLDIGRGGSRGGQT